MDDRKLWVALSYLFVDTEIDLEQLVNELKDYSVEDVAFALFERVAPVCVFNMLSAAPSIWWYFDEEKLINEIELLMAVRSKQGVVGQCQSIMKGWCIRLYCHELWGEVKAEMKKVKGRL